MPTAAAAAAAAHPDGTGSNADTASPFGVAQDATARESTDGPRAVDRGSNSISRSSNSYSNRSSGGSFRRGSNSAAMEGSVRSVTPTEPAQRRMSVGNNSLSADSPAEHPAGRSDDFEQPQQQTAVPTTANTANIFAADNIADPPPCQRQPRYQNPSGELPQLPPLSPQQQKMIGRRDEENETPLGAAAVVAVPAARALSAADPMAASSATAAHVVSRRAGARSSSPSRSASSSRSSSSRGQPSFNSADKEGAEDDPGGPTERAMLESQRVAEPSVSLYRPEEEGYWEGEDQDNDDDTRTTATVPSAPLVAAAGDTIQSPTTAATTTMRMRDRARNMFLSPLQLPMGAQSPGCCNGTNRDMGGGGGVASPRGHYSGASPGAPLSALMTASPMVVSDSVLNAPPLQEEAIKSRHKGDVYFVRQSRSATGHSTFSHSFLQLRVNDMVAFEWFDAAQHVFETHPNFQNVVAGGRNSTAATAMTVATGGQAGATTTTTAMAMAMATTLSQSQPASPWPSSVAVVVPDARDEVAGRMTFRTRFTSPGDYYFLCSKNKRRMRLHVQVVSDSREAITCGLIVFFGVLLLIAGIVVTVLVLAYWLQKQDLFLSEADAVSEKQYKVIRKLQRIVTLYAFPWLATGILVIFLVIILAIIDAILRCYRPRRQGGWHRGVSWTTRRVLALGTAIFCLANVVLLLVAYGLQLNVTDGVNNFARQLGSSVSSTLSAFSLAVRQVEWLATEGLELFPDINFPTDDVVSAVQGIGNILNDTQRWTRASEDIVQGVFRLLPILLFLTLQLGLFASAMAIGSAILRYRRATAAVAWMCATCIGVYACATGVVWAQSRFMSEIYSSVVAFRDDPNAFYESTGLSNDSLIGELFGACTVLAADMEGIGEYITDILESINATLSPSAQEEFSEVFGFMTELVPVSLDALVNFTDYIQANLDLLIQIVNTDGAAVNSFFNLEIVPFLRVVFSVVDTLSGLIDCRIFRQIISSAIPILRHNIQSYNTGLLVFLFILFALGVPMLVFSAGTAYALGHPRKIWHEPRSGRWFRFRYSYKIHRQLLTARVATGRKMGEDSGEEEGGKGGRWMRQLHRNTHPFMHQLLNVKLVCYTASALMLFDSILLVLFNEVARTVSAAPLLRAISYLGCVQLIFLLTAALFRQVWMRWIFHGLAFLLTTVILVISMVQFVAGYVRFVRCTNAFSFTVQDVLGARPYYDTCPTVYAGHQIEVAVYSTVIFLNSVTLFVTLLMLIINERRLKASLIKRPYRGLCAPLAGLCPSFACLYRDHLNMKRLYTSVLIFCIVLFLVLIAVLDNSHFNIIGYRTQSTSIEKTIVQVIDPTVACNGDRRYCALRTNQYMWACAHNAHSSLEDGFVMANHYYNISHQLYAGIRSFMIDLWYDTVDVTAGDDKQDVYLCHTVCLVGRTLFRTVAQEFADFLDKYPGQIIMIIIEQYVNSTDIDAIFQETGLMRHVWRSTQAPPSQNPGYLWPTLLHLIDSNQRAMVFNDKAATDDLSVDKPDWLLYSYNFQFENGYQTNSVEDWSCQIGRGWCTLGLDEVNASRVLDSTDSLSSSDFPYCAWEQEPGSSGLVEVCYKGPRQTPDYWVKWAADVTNCTGEAGPWVKRSGAYSAWRSKQNGGHGGNPPLVSAKLSTVNHMITNGVPSPVQATLANVPASIQLAAFNCSTEWNQVVNILAFDFWTISNPLSTIDGMNQNLAKNGRRYSYRDAWGELYFNNASYSVGKGQAAIEADPESLEEWEAPTVKDLSGGGSRSVLKPQER